MELSILFLGTAGSVPTPQRSLSATLVQRGGDRFLVDCGEGTQRQLIRSGSGINEISHVLLTHLHADHYLGLPGLLKTYELWGRTAPMAIYGPRGLLELLDVLRRLIGKLSFPVTWHELAPGAQIPLSGARWEGLATDHRITSLGWALFEDDRPGRFDPDEARRLGVKPGPDFGRLQRGELVAGSHGPVRPEQVMGPSRPGRRIVLTGDTRPCQAVIEAARGADLLVHDTTFTEQDADRARATMHSTAAEAARVGQQADVRLLALTHLSFRYNPREVLAEARQVFDRLVLPSDFDRLVIPYAEKSQPYWVRGDSA